MEKCSGETIERYWTLFEEFQDAIVFLTGEAKVLDVNKACLDLLGYVREEIIGLDAARLLCAGPNGLHRLQRDIERCGSVRDYEMQFRRKMGSRSIAWSLPQPAETKSACMDMGVSYAT